MKSKILQVTSLSHRYHKHWAISDINFDIADKGVMGLLGSNGAGKSTTMNIICGALKPTKGEVFLDGISMGKNPEHAKTRLGFLPQQAPLHLDLTVNEYLYHCARLRRINEKNIPRQVSQVKDQCGISHFSDRLIKNLSGGYRQRVGIAQAIVHHPALVVLDEPTNGLDPNQITEVRKLIKEIARDRAVIFSSHILSEVQATCQEIRMIEHGRLVFADTVEAFNNYLGTQHVHITVAAQPEEAILEKLPGFQQIQALEGNNYRLTFNHASHELNVQIIALCQKASWGLSEIWLQKSSAEEVFARLSSKKHPTPDYEAHY